MTENQSNPFDDPDFLTLYAPPSYDALNPESQGVYKFVWDSENNIVGVAWSDLSTGAGILPVGDYSPVVDRVSSYLSDMARVQFNPVNAYILIDTEAATSDERTGVLQDAIDAVNYVAENSEIPEEKEDDLDE